MWLKEYYEVLGAATKKAQAYTDQEVSKVRTKFAVVASYADLPNPGRTDTIYLVPKAGFVSVYDQYIYENDQYTDIGDTELDLDSYATDLELSQGLATKVDKVEGYGLSKNDFTDAKDTKLANIEDGAQRNVAADSELDKISTNAIQNKVVAEKFEEVEAEILNEDKVAEGNPITIQTGSIGTAKSTELTMSPIQDLHGYDKPWVGGAGKNLLQLNSHGSNYNITPYGIEVSNYDSANNYYIMQNVKGFAVGTYTVNDYAGGGSATTHRLRVYKNGESIGYASETKFNFTIESAEDVIDIRLYTYEGNTTQLLKPQIEAGSNTTSYEPYANICPISGRTQAEIATQGVNLWDEVTELGIIDQTTGQNQNANNQIRSKNYTTIQPNTQYCFLCKGARISQIFWYDKNNAYLSYTQNTTDSAFITTSPANAYYVRFQFPMAYGTTYQNDSGVNYPSSYTDYSAHTEQTVTRSYGQTVYGGSDAIETGVLTVDRAIVDMGLLTYGQLNTGVVQMTKDNINTISGYNPKRVANSNVISDAWFIYDTINSVRINTDILAENFAAAASGHYLCFPLETPQTTTLTPAQVNLIKGLNNVSTDADSIKMTYTINDFVTETEMNTALESKANAIDLNAKADLTSFGPLEVITASTNYAEGDYMIFEGKFCKASSAITAGDTLEIGTNLTETTIAAELLAIISQLPTT